MENIDLSKASFDDIVFLDRNKSYGAYLLRKLYDKNVLIALGISIALFSLTLAMPVIIKYFSKEEAPVVEEVFKEEVTIIDVPLDPKAPPPPSIEQPPPPDIKTIKFIPPEPAPDEEVNEPPPPPQEKLTTENISTVTKEGKDTIADIPNIPIGNIGELGGTEEDFYMGMVTKEANFPGGLQNYIATRLPDRVRNYISDRGIKGRIFLYFEIDKTGKIINANIPPGKELVDCKMCNEEIVKIIQSMPNWQPAEQNGNTVKRKLSIPIVIR